MTIKMWQSAGEQQLSRVGEQIRVLRMSRSAKEKSGLGWRPKARGASSSEYPGSSIYIQAHSLLGCRPCALQYLTHGTIPRTSGACGLDILSSVDGWWGGLKSEACPTFSVVYSFLNIRLYTKHTLSKRWLVGC